MKITTVTDEAICFDNNTAITFHHFEDCYEWNYADFLQLDDIARDYDFEENLRFEAVEGSGFRFGDSKQMFFIPCYSEQNGYYSSDLEIYYNGQTLHIEECEWI